MGSAWRLGLLARGLAVAAACVAAAAVFWWAGVVPRVRAGDEHWGTYDLSMYFYPKFVYGAQELAAGRLPLWNPYEYCGIPFLGSAQVAVLYPPKNLLFWLLPAPLALEANTILHLALAAATAYLYTRWRGLGPGAGTVAGAVWAFGGTFGGALYHPHRIMTLAWLPLVVLLHERALARRTVAAAALAGAVAALQFFAGHPTYSPPLAVLLAGLTLLAAARDRHTAARTLAAGAAVGAFALAFAAPQLLPLLEMLAESSRETLVGADPWGGAAPLGPTAPLRVLVGVFGNVALGGGAAAGFVLVAVLFVRGQLAWSCLVALALLHAGPFLSPLPVFRLLRADYLLWSPPMPFFVAVLAALGIDRMPWRDARAVALAAALPVGGRLVLAWIGAPLHVAPALTTAAATGIAGARPRVVRLVPAAVAAAVLASALTSPPLPPRLVPYPAHSPAPGLHEEVVRAVGGGRLFAPGLVRRGDQMLARVRVVSGYESSVRPRRLGRLLDAAGLRDHLLGRGPRWDEILTRRPLLDLLGVALLAPAPGVALALPPGPTLSGGRPTFRNPSALGRAFVVHRARRVDDPEAAFAGVVDPGFRPAEEAIVEGPPPPMAPSERVSSARLVVDEPGRVVVEAEAGAPGLLVLADTFFPGWEARVDGARVPVLRVDYAFRGVALSPGGHRVEFAYRPASFGVGVGAAVGAALVAFAAWAAAQARARAA